MNFNKGPETLGNGELHYHSERAGRLAKDPHAFDECGPAKRRGFFSQLRSNRSLLFLFADLMGLILLISLYAFFFADADVWMKNGVEFRLSAFQYGEKVLVSLGTKASGPAHEENPEVVLRVEGREAERTVIDLKAATKGEVFWRTNVERGKAKEVKAEILFGGKRNILTAKIRKE